MARERAISGLLLVGAADADVLHAFAEHVPHIVLVDAQDSTDSYDCILSDGFGGAYATTRHLIEFGHRRIAFLNPEREVGTFCDRQRGYLCALAESDLPIDPALCLVGDGGLYENGQDTAAFLTAYLSEKGAEGPTAIIVANDFFALQVLQVCHSLGLRVPEDISVAGFDDGESAAHCNPPLTTVHVDKQAMGRLALRRLQARLEETATEGKTLPVARYELPVQLIVRASTGVAGNR
jgi:LacI family transcriptional regulator